jgi:hypothetical protein
MRVECALAVSSRRLTAPQRGPSDVSWHGQCVTRLCSDRISPDQGCLDIAVMLEESSRFECMAATTGRCPVAIVFFDRPVALIRVFAIGAYKPV